MTSNGPASGLQTVLVVNGRGKIGRRVAERLTAREAAATGVWSRPAVAA